MRRYADSTRLATLVRDGDSVDEHLVAIADYWRGSTVVRLEPKIDAHATVGAISARWQQNFAELKSMRTVDLR